MVSPFSLHPAEDQSPAPAVALGLLQIAGKSFLANFDQRAGSDAVRSEMLQAVNVTRLELTSHRGLQQVRETWVPGINKQARRIDLQILAVHAERFAISADAGAGPFAAGAKIGLVLHHAIQTLLTPPLRHLLGVSKGLKDAVWRSRDEDLRHDRVIVGSDLSCRHSQWVFKIGGRGRPPHTISRTHQLLVSTVSPFSTKDCSQLRTVAQPVLWPFAWSALPANPVCVSFSNVPLS